MTLALACLAVVSSAPRTLSAEPVKEAKITAVSMFKNGYAVVTREFPIDPSGTTQLGFIPQSSIGTLWFSTSGGSTLLRVTRTEKEMSSTTTATSLTRSSG